MAIQSNTYFQNTRDLSDLCEKDDALEVVSLTNVNNFSYPKFPSGGGASLVKAYTTNIYDGGTTDGRRVQFPLAGTKPTFNSKLLYSGYTSTLTISASSSVLDIGGTKWYPSNFYKNTLPTVLLIVLCGAGGAGAGSTNLYTGSGGGGSGGVGVSVLSTTSGDLRITMGSGGSTSQVAEGGTAGSGGSSIIKRAYSGSETIMTATGGYGGGVRNGGGGGGNGGSATGGTYNYSGASGGGGSGSESSSGSAGATWNNALRPYSGSVYAKSFYHAGGPAGSGGRSGGGGAGSVSAVGGAGSAKSSTASSGRYGAGGGGGGCRNGLFGAASTGGAGGSGYVYIYGGYAP